jgi:hypothetical protein
MSELFDDDGRFSGIVVMGRFVMTQWNKHARDRQTRLQAASVYARRKLVEAQNAQRCWKRFSLRAFFAASDVGVIARFTKPGRPSRSNWPKHQVVANAAAK